MAMDTDEIVLETLAAAVTSIDKRYRRAGAADKVAMLQAREDAFNAYAAARIRLLEDGVIATDADVTEMNDIRQAIGRARSATTIVAGAMRLVQFARGLV